MEKLKRKHDFDDIETTKFAIESIASSISDIILNSENQTFKERCAEILSIQNLDDSSKKIQELLNQLVEIQKIKLNKRKKKDCNEE